MKTIIQKYCKDCDTTKNIEEFGIDSLKEDGHNRYCKKCISNRAKRYSKTKKGFVTKVYARQRTASKERGHNMPTYTKKELEIWLFSQDRFHILFDNWEKSGYIKDKIPSVDRLDDDFGYSVDNIHLVTWEYNYRKAYSHRMMGVSTQGSLCKSVIMMDSDGNKLKEFYSASEARRQTGILHIGCVCLGKRPNAGGYKWKYKET